MLINIILLSIILICIITVSFLIRYIITLKNKSISLITDDASNKIQIKSLNEQLVEIKESYEKLITSSNQLREENSRLNERIKFIEEEKERLILESEIRFKNLANDILQQNSTTFKEQNETRLTEILAPFKDNLEQFKKVVTESYSSEARERFSLQAKIKELIDLNQTISKDAQNLALALKGNSKVQGNWGEMILESILEKSGLERGREFFVQESTYNDEGKRLIADVVINYPDGRKIIIDSKVSLNAYTEIINCDDNNLLEVYKKKHIASIRNHISELGSKKYQDYLGDEKAEFVMMFIPNEAAYICAMQIDPNLWQEAYDKRVLIISPTHLISALRLIEQLWQHDRQTRNAIEIATESGKMYDKFVGFIEDLKLIEKSLNSAQNAYEKALNKLHLGKGNIISKAEKLKEMGAKTTKSLPTTKQ